MIKLLKDINIFIIDYLFLLWAHFPLFAFTDNNNFPNFSITKRKESHDFRVSLFSIYLGEISVFFISFSFSEKKFCFIKEVILSEMPDYKIDDESEEEKTREKKYREHLKSLTKNDIEIEKESLSDFVNNEEQRIETSNFKLNIYTAIIVMVLPLLGSIRKYLLKGNLISLVFFLCVIYSMINLCLIIIQNIKVRSFSRSSFHDLKDSSDKMGERTFQLYYDWQHLKRKADMFVSFIYRIYDWTKIAILFCFFLIIFFYCQQGKVKENLNINQFPLVYTLEESNFCNPYTIDSVNLQKIFLNLQEKKYQRIAILYKQPLTYEIEDQFKKFNEQKFIYIRDDSLNDNQLKIILEE